MVFCLIGLVVFGMLGIFSARYRRYFLESLHCMKRRVTLRPCDTKFDEIIRSKASSKLMKHSEKLGRFVYKRFEVISWLFLAAMIISVVLIGVGVYNFMTYNNCNGPESSDFCILNSFGSGDMSDKIAKLKPIGADDDPTVGNPNASIKIVEVGCFNCPYTKASESIRVQLLKKYDNNASFTFRTMPLPNHNFSWVTAEAADCALEQGKYWEYHDKLFEYQTDMSLEKIHEIASETGLNENQFTQCLESHKYKDEVQKDYDDAVAAGIFATPTYFVNGKPFVGIKSFTQFEQIFLEEIRGTCS
jgi:protein-disulfide isomerase